MTDNMSLPLIVESYLGTIEPIGQIEYDGYKKIYVARSSAPFDGVNTYSTIGLSQFVFKCDCDSCNIREEFWFGLWEELDEDHCGGFFLEHLVRSFIEERDYALTRGITVRFKEPLMEQTEMKGLYVSEPVVYGEIEKYMLEEEPLRFFWLIPIYEEEILYCREYGWEKFEELLEEKDADLFNLQRPSLIK